jgi:formate hydrogenlyase subunit 4
MAAILLSDIVMSLLQAVLIFLLAPLIVGLIRQVKARLQSRRGPPLLQPYYDLAKLFKREAVRSEQTSWVFAMTPYVCVSAVFVAALLVPFLSTAGIGFVGDVIVVVYLLAMMRFFMALAALDAGSSFGGMASSREMMVASIVEPSILLSIFAMSLITGTTDLGSMASILATNGADMIRPALFLAAASFFISSLAENARVPVDNPSTHLELTMIHEGMLLEYSGRDLAIMETASMAKLLVFLCLLANVFFPWGIATDLTPVALLLGFAAIVVKVIVLAVIIGVVESATAKLRLFRLPNLLTASFTLALLGVMSYYIL